MMLTVPQYRALEAVERGMVKLMRDPIGDAFFVGPGIRAHALRALFVERLIAEGAPVDEVKRMMVLTDLGRTTLAQLRRRRRTVAAPSAPAKPVEERDDAAE